MMLRASVDEVGFAALEHALESDLLERPLEGAAVGVPTPDGRIALTLRPFQIVTVRLRLRRR